MTTALFHQPMQAARGSTTANTVVYVPLVYRTLDPLAERRTLLQGVSRVPTPSGAVPGTIALFEPPAFSVLAGNPENGSQASLVAASILGMGRVIAFGHPSYFQAAALGNADTSQLIRNCVQWITHQKSPKLAVYAQPALLTFLQQRGFQAQAIQAPVNATKLRGFDALALNPTDLNSEDELSAVSAYAKNGGGLLTTGIGWGWQSLHPTQSLASDHVGNRLLALAGLAWSEGYLFVDDVPAKLDLPNTMNAWQAINALIAATNGKPLTEGSAQAMASVLLALPVLPENNRSVLSALLPYKTLAATQFVPTELAPFPAAKNPLLALGFTLLIRDPAEQVLAHPASSDFPGAVAASAPRITQTISIDTTQENWHGTGLYAAPGERITIDIPAVAAQTGQLVARIGTQTDGLWERDTWTRAPQIERTFSLTQVHTVIANAFGGMIYIVVPSDTNLGVISVTVGGGVSAPRFVLGQTDPAVWKTQMRNQPAPWAELEGKNLILTVQSSTIRTLNNPQQVLQFWDRVQDINLELAGWVAGRERPMRMAFDRQLYSPDAYMHSGYPIMAGLDSQTNVLNIINAPAGSMPDDAWGFFHELGHNHQSSDWTFDGTTEVTVNLFSMFATERVMGLPKEQGHPNVTRAAQVAAMKTYFCAGAKFGTWKSEPFIALIPYIQLVDAFGWSAYKRTFQDYLALPENERPNTDDEKRDQWLTRFSKTVGKNLGPFFDAWGIPTSTAAKQSVAHLPAWLPETNFPNAYKCADK